MRSAAGWTGAPEINPVGMGVVGVAAHLPRKRVNALVMILQAQRMIPVADIARVYRRVVERLKKPKMMVRDMGGKNRPLPSGLDCLRIRRPQTSHLGRRTSRRLRICSSVSLWTSPRPRRATTN